MLLFSGIYSFADTLAFVFSTSTSRGQTENLEMLELYF